MGRIANSKEQALLREEEKKAGQRIGHGSAAALDWLLAFSQTDFIHLSEGRWIDLAAEMSAFAWGQLTGKAIDERLRGIETARWQEKRQKEENFALSGLRPSKETAQELQGIIQTTLNHLLEFPDHIKECLFPPIELRLGISSPDPDASKQEALTIGAASAKDAFIFHAAFVLSKHVDNVKCCVECRTVFLGARSDQHFCSSRCLNKVMQRRLREKRSKGKAGHSIPTRKRGP